jgi:hypothetical protein
MHQRLMAQKPWFGVQASYQPARSAAILAPSGRWNEATAMRPWRER